MMPVFCSIAPLTRIDAAGVEGVLRFVNTGEADWFGLILHGRCGDWRQRKYLQPFSITPVATYRFPQETASRAGDPGVVSGRLALGSK
jgi:hypothetical protein